MMMSRFAKVALTFGVVAACSVGVTACSGANGGAGGTAATVNGTAIPEQEVTDQIEQVREQAGLTTDEAWGQYLAQISMTPEDVRSQIIDAMVDQELVLQGAADLGIAVDSSEVDEYVDSMKANYDGDEAWKTALSQAGFTEDSYREVIEESLYSQKVGEYFQEQAEVTDEDYVSAAQTYASYYDGSKRSSHILIRVDDTTDEAAMAAAQEQAQDILDDIRSGSIDFAEAAQQYSADTGSAQNGGDVGWDTLNSFVSEYTDALANLELDQVSDPVTSDYGVHIITVTDVFNAPEEITSLDQIPEDFRTAIEDAAASIKANSDYTEWLDGLKESADIVINDMPSGLSYAIDMAPYQEAVEAEAATEGNEAEAASTDQVVTVDAEDTAADADAEGDSSVNDAEEAPEGDGANATASAGANQDEAA